MTQAIRESGPATGILSRFATADRGTVERPLLVPHLAAHIVERNKVVLRSRTFDTTLVGRCFGELIPLLDGHRHRREIVERLADKHSALDVQTALVFLASRGFVVSADFEMNREMAAFWSNLGASPRWAEEQLAGNKIAILGDAGNLEQPLRACGFDISDRDPTFRILSADYQDQSIAEFGRLNVESGAPWLPFDPAGTGPMLGPVFVPDGGGACWECLALRLRANRQIERFLQHEGAQDTGLPTAELPAFSCALSGLVATEIAKWMVFREDSGLHAHVLSLDPADLQVTRHLVVRRPQCKMCGDSDRFRPDRAPQALRLESSPKPVRNSGGVRRIPPSGTLDNYRHLVSPITGVVGKLERISDQTDAWLHVYAGELGNFAESGSTQYTLRGIRLRSAGKGSTVQQSEASALGEAVERVSGAFTGDEIRIRRRYADFLASGTDEAVHPDKVQLFSDRQTDPAMRALRVDGAASWVPERFDPEAEIDWSPVWSLTGECHRYLPTSLLYFDTPPEIGGRFCQGNSNGCASGNSVEEAILQGFFELVERDCVAIWWYNRLQRPAFDFESFNDPYLAEAAARYGAMQRELWMIDLTGDLGIPVFAAVSRRTDGGEERILYGFGCHFDPRIAALRAVCEANQMIPLFDRPTSGDADDEGIWIGRWLKSATVDDHPHMFPNSGRERRTAANFRVPDTEDVRDDIEHARGLVEAQGLEFMVLDQTRPDIGMPVVRVIVPGLRHFWRRLAPGRLYDIPVAMGWLDRPLTERELNPETIAG